MARRLGDQVGHSVGWETSEAWLAGTEVVVAPTRFAMNRCKGFLRRSFVEIRNHDGLDFHAGTPTGAPKHFFASGF
jgi:hypothetical protein